MCLRRFLRASGKAAGRLLLVILLVPAMLCADGHLIARLTGELLDDAPGFSLADLTVELRSELGSAMPERVSATPGGSFEFQDVQSGQYWIRVINLRGETVAEQYILIQEGVPLSLRLPSVRRPAPAAGTVSARALAQRVPPGAFKDFLRGEKAFKAGDLQKSVEYLRRAVQADPDFLEAQNNLGARYMLAGKYGQAAEIFQKAIALDPNSSIAHSNLALALLLLHRNEEAERHAGRAIELDPSSAAAHYILGQSLIARQQPAQEVLKHLRAAATKLPRAHLLAAQVLSSQGKRGEATAELKQYLNSPAVQNRGELQTWLASLEK